MLRGSGRCCSCLINEAGCSCRGSKVGRRLVYLLNVFILIMQAVHGSRPLMSSLYNPETPAKSATLYLGFGQQLHGHEFHISRKKTGAGCHNYSVSVCGLCGCLCLCVCVCVCVCMPSLPLFSPRVPSCSILHWRGQEVEGWPCSAAAKRQSGHPKALTKNVRTWRKRRVSLAGGQPGATQGSGPGTCSATPSDAFSPAHRQVLAGAGMDSTSAGLNFSNVSWQLPHVPLHSKPAAFCMNCATWAVVGCQHVSCLSFSCPSEPSELLGVSGETQARYHFKF